MHPPDPRTHPPTIRFFFNHSENFSELKRRSDKTNACGLLNVLLITKMCIDESGIVCYPSVTLGGFMDIEELMNDMLLGIDKLFQDHFEYGTPEYYLQQDMMRQAARYRLSKAEKDTE